MNGEASGGTENVRRVKNTKTGSPSATRGRYQERQTSNEGDGTRLERPPASQNGSEASYELPRPLSSRPPPMQNDEPVQRRDSGMGHRNKTGKDADTGACWRKYSGHSHPKNNKDAVKPSSDPALGTFQNCAKLGHAEEMDSLSIIPSLASLSARSLDSSTDTSWTSSGESGSAQNEDREQTTPKQCWNTTNHVTLHGKVICSWVMM